METSEQREFMKRLFSALRTKGHLPLKMLCTGLQPFPGSEDRPDFNGASLTIDSCHAAAMW